MNLTRRKHLERITRGLEDLGEDLDNFIETEREQAAARMGDEPSEDDGDEFSTLDYLEQAGSALDSVLEALESANAFA